FIRYCLCAALLPPCPDPVVDDCVPLATVTVRRADCRIVQVCNWGPRKFTTTLPNLGYWLSWLPLAQLLRDFIEKACCRPFVPKTIGVGVAGVPPTQPPSTPAGAGPGSPAAGFSAAAAGGIAMAPTSGQSLTTLLLQSLANKERMIDAQTFALGVLGAVDPN